MTYRRYRRNRSISGEVLNDTAYIANHLSWVGAAILGTFLFVLFYWIVPAWLNHQLSSLPNNMFRPMLEAVFTKRIHWLQWLAIALAFVCYFFAIRNYFYYYAPLRREDERNVSFFSRLLARVFS